MTKILNHINTYADLTAYNNDMGKDFPNISYIQGSDEVKWNKYDPDHIVCVYNVTSTESATKISNNKNNVSHVIIDGVMQPSVVSSYQFDTTGEHIVKFGLTDSTFIANSFLWNTPTISVTIPNGVTTIYDGVFQSQSNIKKIVLPNTVTTIGKYFFYNCSQISSITIPSSVTSIGSYAFSFCAALHTYTIEATTPPTVGSESFSNTGTVNNIYVPAESVETYKTTSPWSIYASRIQAIPTT